MRQRIAYILIIFFGILTVAFFIVRRARTSSQNPDPSAHAQESPTPQASAKTEQSSIPVASGFVYPIGNVKRPKKYSQSKDGDGWYNAQDFGVNNHLGEDWNAESGGNSDCGLPVLASSEGSIILVIDAGTGWGNVLIIRHRLPDGTFVETLYGHLQSFAKASGDVSKGEPIGLIGNANGAYPCHLHFELRLADCPSWGSVGPGYSEYRTGWTDPSNFIDAHRNIPVKSR